MGGADCSQIQQGAPCYNPNTMQNHASFQFNSYYQKNPSASSCDFGGTTYIVSANSSSGSCIYPSSSSSLTPSLQPPSTASMNLTPPATTSITSPTNPASVSPGFDTSGNPPSVLNSSSPTSTYGSSDVPPGGTTSASMSSSLQQFISCIILVAALVSTF